MSLGVAKPSFGDSLRAGIGVVAAGIVVALLSDPAVSHLYLKLAIFSCIFLVSVATSANRRAVLGAMILFAAVRLLFSLYVYVAKLTQR
jgi:hypothetical protein